MWQLKNNKYRHMKLLKNNKLFFLSLILLTSFGCDNESNSNGASSISVRLMDEHANFDKVFVDIIDVMVKVNDNSDTDSGWQSLETINTGVYDLLELTGGLDVLLVDNFQIPSGTLNQIRLILGEKNSIVIDGDTLPLKTPSAQQSGLKIKVNETLEPNISYTFLLDFNVHKSVVIAGNSENINLKPVIRATVEALTGAISGNVTPIDVQTEVFAATATDTISSYTNDEGNFVIVGLFGGTYNVIVKPDEASGLNPQTIENVEVTIGSTTDLGTINLE